MSVGTQGLPPVGQQPVFRHRHGNDHGVVRRFLIAEVLHDAVERRDDLVVSDRAQLEMPGEQVGSGKIRALVRQRPADQERAVIPYQADAAVGTELECPVEAVEVILVDRCGDNAAEAAVELGDPFRENDHRGAIVETGLHQLADPKRVVRCIAMVGKVTAVRDVVARCFRKRRIGPVALGIGNADPAQLRQRFRRLGQVSVEPLRLGISVFQQVDHSRHRDIDRLNGVRGMLGKRMGEVLDVGAAARQRGLLGVERLPGHDAQNAGGHDQRKGDDHGRRCYPPQRPARVWGISMGHYLP